MEENRNPKHEIINEETSKKEKPGYLKQNNIEYSFGGDYFDLFVNSDALIHDCSSFMVEYLYLNKPCCFVIKNNINKYLSKLGKKCLQCHDIAKCEDEIETFIINVQKGTYDIHQKKREKVLNKIKINYPNASKKVLDIITL